MTLASIENDLLAEYLHYKHAHDRRLYRLEVNLYRNMEAGRVGYMGYAVLADPITLRRHEDDALVVSVEEDDCAVFLAKFRTGLKDTFGFDFSEGFMAGLHARNRAYETLLSGVRTFEYLAPEDAGKGTYSCEQCGSWGTYGRSGFLIPGNDQYGGYVSVLPPQGCWMVGELQGDVADMFEQVMEELAPLRGKDADVDEFIRLLKVEHAHLEANTKP